MADRTVKVTLTAVATSYIAAFKAAQKQTDSTTKSVTANLEKQKAAMQTVGHAALLMGTVAAAGLAYIVKTTADFDAQMAQVQSLSHATAQQMTELRDAALEVGTKFGYSATQVAEAETELVKAGISVKDQLGGALTGALTLAADGQMDVASATQIAAEAMTQFQLKGKDVPHIADLLAAGADKALGSVGDLGNALESGGLVAAQFGLSIDDTVGTLSAFAQSGIIGERAGTDLRQMLLKLASPSKEAADMMKNLGIQAYNSQGKFVGITDLAGQLKTKLSGLSQAQRDNALSTIFGSRAIQGANVLYQAGAKGIDSWIKKVNDQGFAAAQAQGKLNSLNGDLQKLGAAFQTDIIKSGGGANDVLRSLAQGATTLLNAISGVPAPILAVGTGVLALVAGVGLLGGGFITLVPKIQATKAAMAELNITGKGMLGVFGKGGGLLLLLTSVASGFTNLASTSQLSVDQLADVNAAYENLSKKNLGKLFQDADLGIDTATKSSEKFKEALNSLASGNFFDNKAGAPKFIDGMSFGLTHLSDVYKTNEAQFKQLGSNLADTAKTDFGKASDQFNVFVKAAGGGKEAVRQLLKEMPDYEAELTKLAAAHHKNLTQQDLFNLAQGKGALAAQLSLKPIDAQTQALAALSGKAVDASGSVEDLADSISNFGKGALDVSGATIAFNQAVSDATDAVKNNGATLDESTQKGRDNQTALDGIASSALALASAQATTGASTDVLTGTINTGRTAFINSATQMGLTQDAANKLADQYGLIPGNVTTAVAVTGTDTAETDVQKFLDIVNKIPNQRTLKILVNSQNPNIGFGLGDGTWHGGRIGKGYAGGGRVLGPGTARSDTAGLYHPLSNGEWVISNISGQASKWNSVLGMINANANPGVIGAAAMRVGRGYATGGRMGSPVSSTSVNVSPTVSLAGARIVMNVGGRQIEAVIQDQIVQNNLQQTLQARRGRG